MPQEKNHNAPDNLQSAVIQSLPDYFVATNT